MCNTEKIVRNKITIVSFLCSIIVIWIHTFNLAEYGISLSDTGIKGVVAAIEFYWSHIVGFAVPTFFFISGFLFFRTFEWSKLKQKYESRIRSILIPYFIWCNIYYFVYVLLAHLPFFRNYFYNPKYELTIHNWLMAMWPECFYTLWFLRNLILFIAVAPLLYILLKNYVKFPVGLISVIVVLVNSCLGIVELPMGLDLYMLGCYTAINHKEIVFYRNKTLSYVGIGLIVLGLLTRSVSLNCITIILFSASIWLVLDLFQLDLELPWWMSITFFIYVAHGLVLAFLEKSLLLIGGQNPWLALLDYLFMPFIAVTVLIMVASVLKKRILLWNFLSGYR